MDHLREKIFTIIGGDICYVPIQAVDRLWVAFHYPDRNCH